MNNGLFNPNNPPIKFVERSLKADVRRMDRGNIPRVDKTIKAINVAQIDDGGEVLNANRKAINLGIEIRNRLRRGELTPEGLANMNNRLALLNIHVTSDLEEHEINL